MWNRVAVRGRAILNVVKDLRDIVRFFAALRMTKDLRRLMQFPLKPKAKCCRRFAASEQCNFKARPPPSLDYTSLKRKRRNRTIFLRLRFLKLHISSHVVATAFSLGL